jgi:hypothetical protein
MLVFRRLLAFAVCASADRRFSQQRRREWTRLTKLASAYKWTRQLLLRKYWADCGQPLLAPSSLVFFFLLLPLLLNSKTVLANNKNPTYPADTPHVYDDKVRGGLVFFLYLKFAVPVG